ncbi:Rne/Rng family ribonuclease [Haloferula sp.]|uniref:Rne/Rng family ribonuclease n=1 Tax=Haloferula sp. TaxID=2497595 RepID=UPI00329F24F9
MIKRIKRILGIGKPNPNQGNTIIVNVEKLERRVALLEDGLLEEYTVEREGDQNIVGGIFKGRVKNIEQGLKAMFVDIGLEKNAFLHFWDAIPAALDSGLEEIKRGNKPKKQKKITSKDIPSIYPIGSEIMIQVSKGPIGTKGPRVTTNISLAGRYLVLMPYTEQFGISRKIDDPKERARLRKIMQRLSVPEGMGIIMRTVALGTRARHFVRDLAMLLEQWNEVEDKRDSKPAPVCAFQEPGLVERTARDFLTDEVDQVLCDDEETTEFIREVSGKISRRAKRRIHYNASSKPIFESLNIQKQIDEAFSRQVWLKCGGYIVIDETEALISVDVNTGRNRGAKDVEKMILQTNLESAEEVARQLRLRNIGGLVVVDFIDMRHRRDQQAVYKAMRERLKRDKAKTQVLQISSIGLMEMTRQRLNESLRDTMFEPCPYCEGKGRVKTTMTMSVEIQRKLVTVINKQREQGAGDLIVVVNSDVLNRFKTDDSKLLVELERSHSGRLIFRSDPALHRERFAIVDAATEKPIEKV